MCWKLLWEATFDSSELSRVDEAQNNKAPHNMLQNHYFFDHKTRMERSNKPLPRSEIERILNIYWSAAPTGAAAFWSLIVRLGRHVQPGR